MGLDLMMHQVLDPNSAEVSPYLDKVLKAIEAKKLISFRSIWDDEDSSTDNEINYQMSDEFRLFPAYLAPKWFQDLNGAKLVKSLPTLSSLLRFIKTNNYEEQASLAYLLYKYGYMNGRLIDDWGRFPIPTRYIGDSLNCVPANLKIIESSLETYKLDVYKWLSYDKDVQKEDLDTYLKRKVYWATNFKASINIDYYVIRHEVAYQRKGVKSSYWSAVKSERGDFYFFCNTKSKLRRIANNCMQDPKSFKRNFVKQFDPTTMFIENNY